LPHTEIAGFFPVQVCENALGTGTIGVHGIYPTVITREEIRIQLAECIGIETLVENLCGEVNIFFLCRNASL
jgi:hypothetical protein